MIPNKEWVILVDQKFYLLGTILLYLGANEKESKFGKKIELQKLIRCIQQNLIKWEVTAPSLSLSIYIYIIHTHTHIYIYIGILGSICQ